MASEGSHARPPRTPEALRTALRDARQYTVSVYAHLDARALRFPLLALVNPPLWELGHIAWFQEYWCLRGGPARAPSTPALYPDADALWNSSVVAHDTRWDLPLPDRTRLAQYMAATLEATLAALAAAADTYFFELALYHEDMHAEALLMTLQTLALPAPPGRSFPVAVGGQAAARFDAAAACDVLVPAQDLDLGAQPQDPQARFVFDNEKWAHRVRVPAFRIGSSCVTNAEFQAFVDAGGYRRPELWTDEGRAWLAGAARPAPAYWSPAGDGAWEERRFDRRQPLAPSEPVQHVNAHEAEAWCRWAGRRLPTEAEWEAAARVSTLAGNAAPDGARLDGGTIGPRGVQPAATPADLIGNVWEWTATAFAPYPGFAPDPYADYSAPWFGTHRVLRGGSWATRARLVHPGFRNFYTPDRHDPFVGFRTCAL